MNNKFYISLEAARLLKEKGYNEETDLVTDEDGYTFDKMYKTNQELPNELFSYPTKAEAIDWLESKGIIVDVDYYPNRWKWSADICRESGQAYMNVRKYYLTRLEAEDAAIIKALELL